MVNPNDPNSEPDEVSPTEPSSDLSSSESGPISDELFESLSELLGESPTSDEPASLPDIESWSEASEPAVEPLSSFVDGGEILEDPTFIQMPERDAPLAEDPSATGDSLSGSSAADDLDDILAVGSGEANEPVPDPWADDVQVPLASSPGEPGLPDDLTPDLTEEPSLPNLDVAASGDPTDIVADPWADPVPAEPTPIESIAADLEDQTLIQPPEVPTPSEAATDLPQAEIPIPDPWVDGPESPTPVEAAAEDLLSEPTISTPEWSGPELDLPGITEPIPEPDVDIPSIPADSVDETLTTDLPISDGDALPTVGETSIPVDAPFPIGEDLPLTPAVPADSFDIQESEEISPSSEIISADIGDLSISDEAATEPISPTAEATSPGIAGMGDMPTGDDSPLSPDVDSAVPVSPLIPDLSSSDIDNIPASDAVTEPIPSLEAPEPTAEVPTPMSPSAEVVEPIGDSAEPMGESISPNEPEVTPLPDLPVPEPVTAASTAMSSSPPGGGDLGALSDKLPLNRYQAMGLLVAFSTLGTITYLGITGNQPEPSVPELSTSSPAASSIPPNNQSSNNPLSNQNPEIAAIPPSPGEAAPANPPGQTPTNPTVAAPPSPLAATGGVETPGAIPSQLDISDVPEDHWAYPFIAKLHAEGVIPDYPDGTFQPDKPVTRAELAAQIQRAFVDEPGQRSLTFSDIAADYWAADAIEGAVDKKFMSGYPEGDFQPDKLVPRYEVLVALVSGLELGIPASPETSLQRFSDQGQLPDWSKGKIAASTQEKIVVSHPDPGLLKPDANATRAEVAAMIYQALVQSGRLDPIESEYVVTPDS